MESKITPMGLYLYDNTIFDNFISPVVLDYGYESMLDDIPEFDRDNFIDYLLSQTIEFETLYANPRRFKFMIGVWSKTENRIWSRLWTTLYYKYNAIWNKDQTYNESITNSNTNIVNREVTGTDNTDRTMTGSDNRDIDREEGDTTTESIDETVTDNGSENKTLGYGKTETETNSGTDIRKFEPGTQTEEYYNQTDASRTEVTTREVTAFNDNTFHPAEKTSVTYPPKTTRNTSFGEGDKTTDTFGHVITTVGSGSDTDNTTTTGRTVKDNDRTESIAIREIVNDDLSRSETENIDRDTSTSETVTETGSGTNTVVKTDKGNIGVTTTQQMIEQERESALYNIYNVIVDSFKKKFCILVY